MKEIKSVLVANRGEIAIRVFRACNEMGIRTVAIYSKEDALSLHRNQADEAYLVGRGKKPVDAYLDIEDIIRIAHEHDVDAIHPGYGFLSENAKFARRCKEEGIIFIGPNVEHLEMFGDKVNARIQAKLANIPMIPGSDGPLKDFDELETFAKTHGFPLMIKAVNGGGGRGMRAVSRMEELRDAYDRAKSEAKMAFGDDDVYVEKLIVEPKHIEVQVIGDTHGNVVHLHERDCSVQRRHQKVVEMAPAFAVPVETRQKICDAAVQIMKNVHYVGAGTVEFLVTNDGNFYFIEVNPRIQVEHTITEMVTGIDIVHTQIRVAEGYSLYDKEVGVPEQKDIRCDGQAIQCRITTEDPSNNFMPDTGKLLAYRSSGGFGIRLDGGNAFTGSVITPYYDSLLVKASSWALTPKEAINKMLRCLREFRIRGVKTNIHFLTNVLESPEFQAGTCNVNFIDEHPELFVFKQERDRGTKMLRYIADVTVNGYAGTGKQELPDFEPIQLPPTLAIEPPCGTKQRFDELGPEKFAQWLMKEKQVYFTDTTWRDAHQSLFATRLRTADMARVAGEAARGVPNLFSLECWGGATFDVAYRFLHEDPWERLRMFRKEVPNVLLQMLLRGANAVGYTSYPDNVVRKFIQLAAKNGVDVFRVFDSLNSLDNMHVAIDEVRSQNKLAEVSLCYTGDILDASRPKYNLAYYVNMAKELANAGANIIAIKDMAGLLKPQAAYNLVSALKDAVDLPIHLHTHEGAGNAIYTYGRAIDAGVDVVDVAYSAFANGTSQPSMNSLYYGLTGHERQPSMDVDYMESMSHYFASIRPYYKGVDHTSPFPSTEVYQHEMPGGQFSNLQQQAKSVGLGDRWPEIKKVYHQVSMMFGDIIKVTPSSKVVGDMTLYMVQNGLTEQDIYEKGETLDFPQSVVEFFEGRLGVPYQGFPEKLQKIVLKGKQPLTQRPGAALQPVDFEDVRKKLADMGAGTTDEDVIAYCLYPKVFSDYVEFTKDYGDISVLDTPTFFFGMRRGEAIHVVIEKGKMLIIKLIHVSEADEDGKRTVSFEFNGQPRDIKIQDKHVKTTGVVRHKADKTQPGEIGATLSGSVVKILVKNGQAVVKGEPLIVTEAMKMETTITSPIDGLVGEVYVREGSRIESGDCLMKIEDKGSQQ
ncbi:pyruvate carboxylase [Veillonella magna]|uniref:pyruvate carboxylase n=1 Tax=Veillonella magna TaxID=464322 RepID=UPI00266663F9|nr:pyruvate carboxylase [Veillonella magna]